MTTETEKSGIVIVGELISNLMAMVGALAFLAGPYLVITIPLITGTFPDATLAQQIFAWVLFTIVAVVTVLPAAGLWLIGCLVIGMIVLQYIWMVLG